MITAATRAMNSSSHTLGDLRTFAQAEPDEALAYLQSVKQNLVSSGRAVPAPIEALLNGPPDQLDTRIQTQAAELAPYFPDQPQMWAHLQAQRAQTIGWTAGTPPAQHAVTGKLDPNGTTLTLESGAVYNLAAASRSGGLPAGWLTGFRADGDVQFTVRGTIGADGKTFLVEDYAPGTSSEFTSGRLDSGNPGIIQTPRGPVRVLDPTFAAQLQRLPRLGVILPGAPVMENNALVYKGNPAKYYALGRFGTLPGAAGVQAAVVNAQQQVTSLESTINTYTTQIATFQQQLTTLQVVAANPAETAALANLTALEAAQETAQAATAAALQVYTQTQQAAQVAAANPQTAAAANQAFADAQNAYTTVAQQMNAAAQALAAAQQATATVNAAWPGILSQRTSVRQQLTIYEQALTTTQQQLPTAQAALTQAQAQAAAAAAAQPAQEPDAIITGASGDFAYSVFSGKPINIRGEKEAARANHNDRMWALGSFTFDAQGVPQSFEAEYLSLPLGGGSLPQAQVAEADDWLGALAATQAGVGPSAPAPVSADFERHSP